jgi:acyl-coenzyme A synthetase/AMP-(fatty) acid ligase/acyl carrier protein
MLGLRLVILPENCQRESEKFAEMIAHHGITRITVVPAFLEQLVNPKRDLFRHLASIRSVTVGSAALSPQIIRHFHDVLPGVQLMNAYGATESGTLAMGEMHPDDVESVGLPAPNMDVYLLDENLIPVANGDVGEICGAGPSLALGYLERDELTAERFIPNPVHREKGLVYRTGDRGRLLPDGRLQLMGRIDRQVKVRGYRVELSELEVALQQLPGVREAAVIHQPLDNYDNRLIAYLCTNEGITVSRVRKHLRTRVPDHMLPSAYVFLDTLPRTPIGKVIVSSLPEPGSGRPKLDTPYVVPATILEDQIASIWAEVLEIACIGRDDHFMDVGGDSILAAQIVAAVESRTGIRAGIMSLFEWPTVAEFSKVIALELEKAQKL